MKTKQELRTIRGKVVSKSGDKSIKVVREYLVKHPKYGKYVKKSTKYGVHDEQNAASVGDIVSFTETRPISKSKSWRLVDIIEKAIIK